METDATFCYLWAVDYVRKYDNVTIFWKISIKMIFIEIFSELQDLNNETSW